MILAAGATGRLRPVVEELLARGHDVRVTAREPGSSTARELAGLGAQIVRADLDELDSLRQAARGVETIFAAGSPHRAGPAGETRHGINVARAAADTAVEHLVFSSGAGAGQRSGVPVLDSKHAVEQRIRELGVPHTILAPVYFMQNAFNPWNLSALASGVFALALPPDRALQQLAIEDPAAVAAEVVDRRDDFIGQRLELAGDELTGEQAAAALSRATGRRFAFGRVPLTSLAPGLRALFEWLARIGHQVDIGGLRRSLPDVHWHAFEGWAGAQDWSPQGTKSSQSLPDRDRGRT